MATHATPAGRRLARTINVGIDLGSPLEHGWTFEIQPHHLDACVAAGFSAIRLAVCWAGHTQTDNAYALEPSVLERVLAVVEYATGHGLAVVVNNARDPELMLEPARHRQRLLAVTRQVATALAPFGADVVLEPLSEPQHQLDREWNRYLADLIAVIREVDPGRTIIVGPRSYNNARYLGALAIPAEERNLIVTVHHYWPVVFTMQGETWVGETPFGLPSDWLGTSWESTEPQRGELTTGFDAVAAYAQTVDRPIFVGEFGSSSNADMSSRVRWAQFNRELAEQRGFSWGYWSFGPSFALYDFKCRRWHSELLSALIP